MKISALFSPLMASLILSVAYSSTYASSESEEDDIFFDRCFSIPNSVDSKCPLTEDEKGEKKIAEWRKEYDEITQETLERLERLER